MPSTPKHNLMALSSAAIIAVYAAGYTRTKAAAAKIAERDERRPPIRQVRGRDEGERRKPTAEPELRQQKAVTGLRGRTAEAKPREQKAVVQEKAERTPVDTATATTTTTNADGGLPAATVPTTPTNVAAVDTTKHADSAKVAWKDGYYFGWGTSRHGDIQAGVEIKDGRIVSALITQCLTRYSCSWIDMLPGQVVSRQSAEVDFVSGATQSTNAFYYAVVEALSKAR